MEIIIGGKYMRKIFFLEAKIWRELVFGGKKYGAKKVVEGINIQMVMWEFAEILKGKKIKPYHMVQYFLNLASSSNLS